MAQRDVVLLQSSDQAPSSKHAPAAICSAWHMAHCTLLWTSFHRLSYFLRVLPSCPLGSAHRRREDDRRLPITDSWWSLTNSVTSLWNARSKDEDGTLVWDEMMTKVLPTVGFKVVVQNDAAQDIHGGWPNTILAVRHKPYQASLCRTSISGPNRVP